MREREKQMIRTFRSVASKGPVIGLPLAIALTGCTTLPVTHSNQDSLATSSSSAFQEAIGLWTVSRGEMMDDDDVASCIIEQLPVRLTFDGGTLTTLSLDYRHAGDDGSLLANKSVSAINLDGRRYRIRTRSYRSQHSGDGIYSGDSRWISEFSSDGAAWIEINNLLPALMHSSTAKIFASSDETTLRLDGLQRAVEVCTN